MNDTENTNIPLKSMPIWQDITPIPQDEGPNPAVRIVYTDEFKETMEYFRAILELNEKSERAFHLTTRVIEGNAGNYTAWHYRRLCLEALKSDLQEEFEFITETALDSPKNYQIWYHRQVLVRMSNDPSREKAFTKEVIEMDSKNYHAWAHRQWVISTFDLWDDELDYVNELLTEDFRNNSAWNQRWFILKHTKDITDTSVLTNEVNYALKFVEQAPNNESPYNYIRGLMRNQNYSDFPQIEATLSAIRNTSAYGDKGVPLVLSLLVDVYSTSNIVAQHDKASEIAHSLAMDYDTIRKKYWLYRKEKIQNNSTSGVVEELGNETGIRIAQNLAKAKISQ